MKILIYTDNHFCRYSSILRSRGEKYSKRLENQIESLNWVNQIAIEKECDRMIHLGDFFDKPDLTAEEISALKEIKWNDLPKDFILGNHEMYQDHNSLNVLSQLGNIIIEPTNWLASNNVNILYLPYILENDRKPLSEYIYKREGERVVVLSHNDIKGIRYGQYESKIGFDIKEICDNCNLFINGHLHNQTQINEKIINLGDLTGLNFNEDGFKYSHCVGILDTYTLDLELIHNPYAINFYKLEEDINYDFNHFKTIIDKVENGVLSVKVPQSKLKEVRDYLQTCSNIIEFRVISSSEN